MNPVADLTTDTARISPAALRWTLLGAPLLILFTAYLLTSSRITATPQAAKQNKPLATTDDWRRTADGWERTQAWPTIASNPWHLFAVRNLSPTNSSTSPRATTRVPRLDTHPAALALAQLLASVLGLVLFRNPNPTPLHLSSLLITIARSFRASAFGS